MSISLLNIGFKCVPLRLQKKHTKVKKLIPDAIAGLVVALIALPLTLGVAKASGVSEIAGLKAAIVGTLAICFVRGFILKRGSNLAVTGIAAGLILIIFDAVDDMNKLTGSAQTGFRAFLALSVTAGVIIGLLGVVSLIGEKLLGKTKTWKKWLWKVFPAGLAQHIAADSLTGMKVAIGVMLFLKQLFPFVGAKSTHPEIADLIIHLKHDIATSMNTTIVGFGALALVLFLGLKYLKKRTKSSLIIPALMLMIIGGFIGLLMPNETKYFVQLPTENLFEIITPDFSVLSNTRAWQDIAFLVAIIYVETMGTAAAVTKLDREQRAVNFAHDLATNGCGIVASGFVGGMPMIFEMVRSNEAVDNGSKTWKANMFHGLWLLVIVVLFAWLLPLLNRIPLTVLASILLVTAFGMIKKIKELTKLGNPHVLVGVITVVFVLTTDLAIGILVGVVAEIVVFGWVLNKHCRSLWQGFMSLFRLKITHVENGHHAFILEGFITPFTLPHLKANLKNIPDVVLDLSKVEYIHPHALITGIPGVQIVFKGASHLERMSLNSESGLAEKGSPLLPRFRFVQDFATQNGFDYQGKGNPFKATQVSFYDLMRGSWTKECQFARKTEEGIVITFADRKLTGISDDHNDTIVHLKGVHAPDFVLTHENIFDKFNSSDVDFPECPRFSEKYLLIGEESKLRKYFELDGFLLAKKLAEVDLVSVESKEKEIFLVFNGLANEKDYVELIALGSMIIESCKKWSSIKLQLHEEIN